MEVAKAGPEAPRKPSDRPPRSGWRPTHQLMSAPGGVGRAPRSPVESAQGGRAGGKSGGELDEPAADRVLDPQRLGRLPARAQAGVLDSTSANRR